jgi:hypothetical protein
MPIFQRRVKAATMVKRMGEMTISHSSRVCKKDGCCIPRVGQDMGFDRELF